MLINAIRTLTISVLLSTSSFTSIDQDFELYTDILDARSLIKSDPSRAETRLNQLIITCDELNETEPKSIALGGLARILNLRAYTDSAEHIIRSQLRNPNQSEITTGLLLTDLAQVHRIKKQFDTAMMQLDTAIRLFENRGRNELVHESLLEKVQVMSTNHFAHEPLEILNPLLLDVTRENPDSELIHEINAMSAMIHMYNSSSTYGVELGLEIAPQLNNNLYLKAELLRLIGSRIRDYNEDSAKQYLYESLKISLDKDFTWVSKDAFNTLAEIESLLLNIDSAQQFIDLSLGILPDGVENYAVESDWYQLGHIAYWKEDFKTSIEYGDLGYNVLKETNHKLEWLFTNMLYWSYKKLNMPDSAFKYGDLNRTWSDESINRVQNGAMDHYKIVIEDLKNTNKILSLEYENMKIQSHRNQILFLAIVLTIIALSTFVYLNGRTRLLKSEIQSKDSEMRQQTVHMIDLGNKMAEVETTARELRKKREIRYQDIQKIINQIKMTRNMEKDWEKFDKYFGNRHKDFYDKLEVTHPGMPVSSKRLAALVRMQLSNDEIGSILNVTSKSARMGKYRLKQRLALSESDDLYAYLRRI